MCVCMCAYLGREHGLVQQQGLAEGLLLTLVDVGETQHLFGAGGGKVQEGLVPGHEGLVLAGDQQHAVPAEIVCTCERLGTATTPTTTTTTTTSSNCCGQPSASVVTLLEQRD